MTPCNTMEELKPKLRFLVTCDYPTNLALGDSKLRGKTDLSSSTFIQRSDRCSLLSCQFCPKNTHADFHFSIDGGMSDILLMSTPFKIFNSVVSRIAIFMVHIVNFSRIFYEGKCNKSVNGSFPNARANQLELLVTQWVYAWFHPFTLMVRNSTVFSHPLLRITPDSSIFRHCIQTLISFNIFHVQNSETTGRFASIPSLQSAKLLMN